MIRALAVATVLAVMPVQPGGPVAPPPPPATVHASINPADLFQRPLASWEPHCLGFGSQWRYCNGIVLRACATGVWLHTGVDVQATAGEPVAAAGDGVIIGYLVDPQFRGGILVRHRTSSGVVITQYWHVWLRAGFAVGVAVRRGQVFADIASMGDRTHFHFAVFVGDYNSHTWNGALPPSSCDGYPAFPFRFVDPNAFLAAHALPAAGVPAAPVRIPHGADF